MKEITIKAYAKINLSLDVLGLLHNGYHAVEMVMQQIELHDVVTISWEATEERKILLSISNAEDSELPINQDNIAYKAAELMMDRCERVGTVKIHIEKNIPIAAGLAGGSANAAAVLHGLNLMWKTNLNVIDLSHIGVLLGADIPFCVMGQAKGNENLFLCNDPLACTCAVAEGIGEELTPIEPLDCHILISKPSISISTAEAYKGLDEELKFEKPRQNEEPIMVHHIDTKELVVGLKQRKYEKIVSNMLNMLELFSIKRYPIIMYTKDMIENQGRAIKVLMSGSGPTVFAIYEKFGDAEEDYSVLHDVNAETYVTKTLI